MTDSSELSRRTILGGIAAVGATALVGASVARADEKQKRLGLADFSYIVRNRKENTHSTRPRFADALEMLEHLHTLGYGGLQCGSGGWTKEFAGKIRAACERHGMYIECSIGLPKTDAAVVDFNAQIEVAKEAGATVIRSVFTGARRYEFFESAEAFKKFKDDSWAAIQRAEPVAAKQGIKLAIENHKDLRSEELVEILKRLSSAHVGITFDTGNNIALLEDPDATTSLLAPHTFTLHLKDMGVAEYEDGFLLSEVVLGTGFLDLKRIVDTCRAANPSAQFNLEMPARDPLKVPVLTKKYWASLGSVPGAQLADTLALVHKHKGATPLPRPSQLPLEDQLTFEEEQITKSLLYAREKLGI